MLSDLIGQIVVFLHTSSSYSVRLNLRLDGRQSYECIRCVFQVLHSQENGVGIQCARVCSLVNLLVT